ncbi:alpha/beta-hydrolase [Mollisia scopiformis]|uniref:Alpha/beta-hydrolase n=1 Tax=Mollisia scopiformis TaxID=149040 RepID=A0A132B2Z4_MOLSC|nr:alpha/beta-hydrolase [Mollisia scopiformis]KUJ06284.1 alpha/beta-hydrolase [Mollisia scopiformis]
MEAFPYTKYTSSRDLTYSYIHIKPSQGNRTYILFLHGFPSSSRDWRHQIDYFQQRGYGIIVPDLLGYGGTSKPLDTTKYNMKGMASDVHEILEHENIEQVVGIGHDWGSFLLSRLMNYCPILFSKLVFLDVGYSAPGTGLTEQTVKYVNSMVQEHMGYSVFGYFLFFKEDHAAQLMNAHVDSMQSLMHSRDAELGKKYMGAEGGTRNWLEAGKVADPPSYRTKEDIEYDRVFFSAENGGYGPCLNWYISQLNDINREDDKGILEKNHTLQQPTLLVSSNNFITAAADMASQMRPLAPKMKEESLDAGHWLMLEKPNEVNVMIEKFLEE